MTQIYLSATLRSFALILTFLPGMMLAQDRFLPEEEMINPAYTTEARGHARCIIKDIPNCLTKKVTLQAFYVSLFNGTETPVTVLWSTGQTAHQIIVPAPGSYSYDKGILDCDHLLNSIDLDAFFPNVLQIQGPTTICPGDNNIELNVNDDGYDFDSFEWSPPNQISLLEPYFVQGPGTFTLTATDRMGCTYTDVHTIVQSPPVNPNIFGDIAICPENDQTNLVVTPSFSQYQWSTGATSNPLLVTTPGTYELTVTNVHGCTGTTVWEVSDGGVNQVPISLSTPAICPGGTDTLRVFGFFLNYLWSTGQITPSIVVNQPGTYDVTVTNAYGCTGTGGVTVNSSPVPQPGLAAAPLCPGASALLTPSGGPFSTVKWNTGATTPVLSITQSGNYSVTVSNGSGCTGTAAVNVPAAPAAIPVITGPLQICTGQNAVLEANAGFSTYLWSTGANTQTIPVNSTGTYSVTVTNTAGCSGTAAQAFNVVPLPTPQITVGNYNCDLQMTLNAGAGYSSYLWSTGATTPSLTTQTAGSFSVTVTDANGCTGNTSQSVNIPQPPVVNVTGIPQLCPGASGQVQATAGFNQYNWSSGQNTQTITATQPNTYSVTATDQFGCTATNSFTVGSAPSLQTSISGPAQICINSAGQLSVTGTFAQYAWSTGANTQTISVSTANTYTVTVYDSDGCSGSASHPLTVGTALTPNIAPSPYNCDGKIDLSAGLGFASYIWSTGATTSSISSTSNGTVSVTVTDAQGCSGSAQETVTIPQAPVVSVSGTNGFCQGLNGALNASGTFPQYLWSTGANTPSILVSQQDVFTVTVTDQFGCTATDSQQVTVFPLPQTSIVGPSSICIGFNATLSVTGTFASYIWSGGQTTPTLTTNQQGNYGVVVTDANGCTGQAAHVLTVAASLQPIIAAAPYNCDKKIDLDGGAGYVSYQWSNGATTQSISATANGTYALTVADAQGCTGTATQAITIPADPAVNITGVANLCPQESGQLTATTGFTTYAWSNGASTQIATVSQTGNYTVTVTDQFGCTTTDNFSIVPSPPLQTNVLGPAQICIGGTATFSVTGSFAQYLWSNGATTPTTTGQTAGLYTVTVTDLVGCSGVASKTLTLGTSLSPAIAQEPYKCDKKMTISAGIGYTTYTWSTGATTPEITVAANGNYTVTVTDDTGCSGTAVQTVNIPADPLVAITGPTEICKDVPGSLAASAGFNGYEWSTGATTASASIPGPGFYRVTVTDVLGCTATESHVVNETPGLTPFILGPPQVCFGLTGDLRTAGTYTAYNWSTGAATPTTTVSATGLYYVTVTDAKGCTGVDDFNVTVLDEVEPTVIGPPSICAGETATLGVNANYPEYLWSNNATTKTIKVSLIGSYSVTVTDVNGCTGEADFQLKVFLKSQTFLQKTSCLVADTGVVVKVLKNQFGCDSTVTTHTSLVAAPVTQVQKASCFVADTGVVVKVVQTTAGCDSIVVTHTGLHPQPTATASVTSNYQGKDISCSGLSDGSARAQPSSGTGPYTYVWSSGGTTQEIKNLASGAYRVTVTDANGCKTSASVELTAPPPVLETTAVKEVECFQLGKITLSSASGGTGPYTVVVNGETEQTNGQTPVEFSDLLPGTYKVVVTDANGCTADEEIKLVAPSVNVQTIEMDTSWAYQGQQVQLFLPPGFDTVNTVWKTNSSLSCTKCTSPFATIWRAETFEASYPGYGGCKVVALYPARVKPDPTIYVPNVILTSDDENGTFTVFGGSELINIRLLRVYTRWGELVQQLVDFPPNGPTGWKGDFRGKQATPGVYVYYAEVEMADGSVRSLKGDVTVVRQ